MRLLYSLLWYALLPLLFARLWWRGRRAPAPDGLPSVLSRRFPRELGSFLHQLGLTSVLA